MKQKFLPKIFLMILLIGSAQLFAQVEPVPILHYSFEDNLLDDSGNGNDALARGTSGVPAYGETDGLKGKYLDLSANADNDTAALFFISTPDSILSSSDAPYTITGWTKIVTDTFRMQIVNQPATGGLTQFLMKWYQASAAKAWISGVIAGNAKFYHSSPSDMHSWFHFALVVDPANDTLSLWYDGVFAKGVPAEIGWSDTIAPFFFGAQPNGREPNDGVFDEIYVFDKLLTGEEIMANYLAPSNTECDPIDVTVMKNETALYVTDVEGASYQWIDCSDGSAITGATDALYTPLASGEYKVAVTLSAECTDTSECTSITISTGINRINDLGVAVYPNPVTDMLSVDLGTQAKGKIELINLVGQTVLQTTLERQHSRLDLSNLDSGVYLLIVSVEERSSIQRIIKL